MYKTFDLQTFTIGKSNETVDIFICFPAIEQTLCDILVNMLNVNYIGLFINEKKVRIQYLVTY